MCSFEYMMGGIESTFTEMIYMKIIILIENEHHVKFDEAIFQEKYPHNIYYWTG